MKKRSLRSCQFQLIYYKRQWTDLVKIFKCRRTHGFFWGFRPGDGFWGRPSDPSDFPVVQGWMCPIFFFVGQVPINYKMVNWWFWCPVFFFGVGQRSCFSRKIQIARIWWGDFNFGDPRIPNHRATNHQLSISWQWRTSRVDMAEMIQKNAYGIWGSQEQMRQWPFWGTQSVGVGKKDPDREHLWK